MADTLQGGHLFKADTLQGGHLSKQTSLSDTPVLSWTPLLGSHLSKTVS